MWTPWNVEKVGLFLFAGILAAILIVALARAAHQLPRLIDPKLSITSFKYHGRYRTAFIFASLALALCCAWRFGSTPATAAAIVYVVVLLALAWMDAETGLLPDVLTLGLLWAGLLVNLSGGFVSLPDAVLGAAAGYLALWSVSRIFLLVTGREGMGHGDFKLLAALGAWTGWWTLPSILVVSSVLALFVALWMRRTGRAQAGDALRYGPYLAGAGIWTLLTI
jgi:leader peptidase (prepilin peptidase)/N-methyltransferase